MNRTDRLVYEMVLDALSHNPDVDLNEIELRVSDGVVTLQGFVESRIAKKLTQNAVNDVPGVGDVVNELLIRPADTLRAS